jgi:hypothetical protein
MNGIQVILISGIVGIFLYYFFRLRNAFIDLIALAVFSILAIYCIIFPDSTSLIANKLGVGRGTDMLFYTCILLFLFLFMKLFARIKRLENQLTKLIREQAKSSAIYTKKDESN